VWVKPVQLDEVSRKQQHGEGHFDTLEEVPTHAITLTVPALLAAKRVLCIVPEARKANAVHACLRQPVSEDRPGSVLRTRRARHALPRPGLRRADLTMGPARTWSSSWRTS
jgi:glucosamine-6-phosphate deaminase